MLSIGEMRRQTKLTQAAIAERFGVSVRTWQNWEAGRRVPHRHLLELAFKSLAAELAEDLNLNGPQFSYTTAEKRGYASGNEWPTVRRLRDGTWLPDYVAAQALTVGTLYWTNAREGQWVKMIRGTDDKPHRDQFILDGEVAPFPPFDWRKHEKK